MLSIAEVDVVELNIAVQAGDNLSAIRHFRFGVQHGLRHIEDGFDLRNGHCDACHGGEGTHHHAVGSGKGIIFRGLDFRLHGEVIHQHGADKGNGHGERGIDLQEKRRVILDAGTPGISLCPLGEGPLLRPGQLDFLHAGDEGIGQAAFLGTVFHHLLAQPHLHKGGEEHHDNGGEDNQQCRPNKPGSKAEDLPHIQQRRDGCDAGREHAAQQKRTQLTHCLAAAGEFTGAVFSEEGSRKAQNTLHHGSLHRNGGFGLNAGKGQLTGRR